MSVSISCTLSCLAHLYKCFGRRDIPAGDGKGEKGGGGALCILLALTPTTGNLPDMLYILRLD
jgi:hypothetical protein